MNYVNTYVSIPETILPATPGWNFTPNILTDEVISTLLNRVQSKRKVAEEPLNMIVSGLQFMAQTIRMHLPMAGDQMTQTSDQMSNYLSDIKNSQYSTRDYLTGHGPVGSYIAENLDLFKLFSTIHHPVGDNCIQSSVPTVDAEFEYRYLFNYNPLPIGDRNNYAEEFKKIEQLVRTIQLFIYSTGILKFDEYQDLKIETVLSNNVNHVQPTLYVNKTGVYFKDTGYSKTPSHLAIVAPIRDTKVLLVLDPNYNATFVSNLFYFHRTENTWVRFSDSSGSFYLEGTYEALHAEAVKLFDRLGYDLDNDVNDIGEKCLKQLLEAEPLLRALSENEASPENDAKQDEFQSLFPKLALGKYPQGLILSFEKNNVKYGLNLISPLDATEYYSIHLVKTTSNGYSTDRIFDTALSFTANALVSDRINRPTVAFFLTQLSAFLTDAIPKLHALRE